MFSEVLFVGTRYRKWKCPCVSGRCLAPRQGKRKSRLAYDKLAAFN